MKPHIHVASTESYAFGFEAETLFKRRISSKFDRTAGTHDPVPGQVESRAKHSDDLARGSRMSSGFGDRPVRRYSPSRDCTNRFHNIVAHRFNSSFDRIRFFDSMRQDCQSL
jgi:hypothetical protein